MKCRATEHAEMLAIMLGNEAVPSIITHLAQRHVSVTQTYGLAISGIESCYNEFP
jgi:hypothetical protein